MLFRIIPEKEESNMKKIKLYRYLGRNGILDTKVLLDGINHIDIVVLQADPGKILTNGEIFRHSVTVEAMEINGHDFEQIEAAFAKARTVQGKPFAIVMKTVKGKGVSFMENNAGWHGKATNAKEFEQAMAELRGEA